MTDRATGALRPPRSMRRSVLTVGVVLVLALLTAALVLAPRLFTPGLVSWSYANSTGTGAPSLVVPGEPAGDDWVASHAPRFGERPFSVLWEGWLPIAEAGTYEFVTASDDGSWLLVDEAMVVDNGGEHPVVERRGTVRLTPGLHHLRVGYMQLRGGAALHVRMGRDGQAPVPLTRDGLFPTRLAHAFPSRPAWLHMVVPPGYLLATAWASALPAAVLAWMVLLVRRHTAQHAADPAGNRWLWTLLALASALMAWQATYGLPVGWDLDELNPADAIAGLHQRFSNGWHGLYSPIYYYVIGALSLPFMLVAAVGATDAWSTPAVATQALLYRASALLCGLVTVYLAYRCGSEAFGNRRSGLWAGLVVAAMPNVVMLAKLAKPDMPYVAAFMAAMLVYLKCLRDPSAARYAAFALAGMTAICIKDQAYGLIVLPAAHLVWLRWRQQAGSFMTRAGAVLRDRALLGAAAVSVGTFAVAHNVVFNWPGLRQHVALVLVGGGGTAFRMYDGTLGGHATMLADALGLVPWMLGWGVTALALVGGAAAWHTHRHALVALLLPVVSYYLCFIVVIRYQYDRFYLAPAVLLSICAGHGLAWLWQRSGRWPRVVAVAVAGYALARGASVDLMMLRDSRVAAEAWLASHVSEHATVGALGPAAYLPRPGHLRFLPIGPHWDVMEIVAPEFLVVNTEYAQRERDAAFYRPLLDGTHEVYRPVARFKSPPGLAVLAWGTVFQNGREDPLTNLDKINPEIVVFARRPALH